MSINVKSGIILTCIVGLILSIYFITAVPIATNHALCDGGRFSLILGQKEAFDKAGLKAASGSICPAENLEPNKLYIL